MATDGDRHADEDDDECDQLNRTNDHEPYDNMSNDDADADIDVNDHNDKDDGDDDEDAEQVHIVGDDPVCKSCGNFGHRSHRDHRCPDHHCAHCRKQGHSKRFCPDVQCPHCDLFGHVNKADCKYKHCINVDVDWLNILLSVSASHTITELFQASECTVDPNILRSGGKFRKFTDWEHVKQTCDAIGAEQLLELKRVTTEFQKDRMREHKSIHSKLNKRTEAPVDFAFTADYDHISVAKCRFCKAWLFWPETTQKEWCCGQGKYIDLINPWSQPTDAFRSLCIDDTSDAKSFRLHSRALNQENSFASFGVKWGETREGLYPSFLSITGVSYYRLLNAGATGPLQSYIYDTNYQLDGLKISDHVRNIVKDCVRTKNDVATNLTQLGQRADVKEMTLHLESNIQNARANDVAHTAQLKDVTMLVVKPIGHTKATPRVLVIHPTTESFQQAHPNLRASTDQSGIFIPHDSIYYDVMAYPFLTMGGTTDFGWGVDDFFQGVDVLRDSGSLTLNIHTRFHALAPELKICRFSGRYERDGNGQCIIDDRWMARTSGNLRFPISRTDAMGRLCSQWLCDYKARKDDVELNWIRHNQKLLTRSSAQQEADVLAKRLSGEPVGPQVTKMPKSFYGSKNHLHDEMHNGLALVRKIGSPLFFITFTFNPKWKELTSMLLPGQTASDRPLLVARIFRLKLKALLARLTAGLIFVRQNTTGTAMKSTTYLEVKNENGQGYVICVTEFQKRGLPHAHIAYRPANSPAQKKLPDGEKVPWVDNLVCAQLPSDSNKSDLMARFDLTEPEFDRLKYLVSTHMLHDRGQQHKRSDPTANIWCHKDGKCEEHFPKPHNPNQECSYVDSKGYMQYKRLTLEDGWVVPYNPRILLLFECHCNVEIAGTVNVIMYLYKYLYKGPDQVKMYLEEYKRQHPDDDDELMQYRIARVIAACEAAIRLLEFPMYIMKPSVESINIHLELGDDIKRKGASLFELYLHRPRNREFDDITIAGKTLTNGRTEKGFFERYIVTRKKPAQAFITNSRKHDPHFEVFDIELSTNLGDGTTTRTIHYVYKRRKANVAVNRLQQVYLAQGELWYLRLILLHSAPRSFLDARTTTDDGGQTTVHETYAAAARAMGLLQDMDEGIYCLLEAVENEQRGEQLRDMFCMLLTQGWGVAEVLTLTDVTHKEFENFTKIASALEDDEDNAAITSTPHLARQKLLQYIYDFVCKNTSKTMQDYGLPAPRDAKTELQMERLKYDDPTVRQQLRTAFERDKATWTAEFHTALATIIDVRAKHGGFVVIEGAGGAGKTFLTKGLVNYFRSEGLIVRVAAPTGLAATLYEGGMTMHDLFKLPVLDNAADEEFTSNVDKHPQRQELLNECDILFIDEAFNLHLGNLNASIEALQAIRSTDHEAANKTIVFVGDRKQILPVVKGEASDAASIAACIVSMPHWGRIPKINLTSRFRNQYDLELAKFVEAVANGAVKSEKNADGYPQILLPPDLVKPFTDTKQALDWFMDGTPCTTQRLSQNKAILCATNNRVDELNEMIQKRHGRKTTTLTASTQVKDGQDDSLGLTTELLAECNKPGNAPHVLKFAEGDVAFLMRTLDKRKCLTNNTRVQILDVKRRFIKVQTMADRPTTHLIPRIIFSFAMTRRNPFVINRLQFPLRLAYAMTFNKSQGQTLEKVLIDGTTQHLPARGPINGAFMHGHCNVALSRVRNRESLGILVDEANLVTCPTTGKKAARTTNIVCRNILDR